MREGFKKHLGPKWAKVSNSLATSFALWADLASSWVAVQVMIRGARLCSKQHLLLHTRTTIDRSVESIVDNAARSQPDDVYEIALCIHRTPHVRQNPDCGIMK